MNRYASSGLALLLSLLPGCAVGPNYRPDPPAVPPQWHQSADQGLAPGTAQVETWWDAFHDEQLTRLIARAAEGNLDIRLAVLRIRQARAARGIAAGELLPALGASGSYERSKRSPNSLFGGLGQSTGRGAQFRNTVTRGMATAGVTQGIGNTIPGAAGAAAPLANGVVGLLPNTGEADTPEMNLFTSGFDASWEIDVFGGIRRGVEAADAELAAAVEDYRGALVSLLAEVAVTYVDVRTLQAQIAATARNIELQRETLALTQARRSFDLASDLEVHQAETNLATTESQLPALEANLATAVYRLAVLLGEAPGALDEELAATAPIPAPVGETFVGVPADILRRRPDIRVAERRLAAETARIGVAAADLYPRLSLSGTFGFESMAFDQAIGRRSIAYGFGPAVRWNIFDGLRNLNRIAAQQAAAHQAFVIYQQAVLRGLQEVESAMVQYKREQVRREALARAADSAQRAADLAQARYEDGLTDFQDVVDAERSLADLEISLAESHGAVALHLVALYKALGGGWSPAAVPQRAILDATSPALARPAHYFFSGGRAEVPWAPEPENASDTADTAAETAATH